MVIVADDRIVVPAGGVADAAKAAAAGLDQSSQYGLHSLAERQVRVTDNSGGHASLATMVGVALLRETRDVFDLADGAQLDRPVLAIALAAVDEDGRFYVVAACGVGQ